MLDRDPAASSGARRSVLARVGAVLTGAFATAAVVRTAQAAPADDATSRMKTLEGELQKLTARVGILEDVQAIRRLQHSYGYYMDKCLYEQVVDLFAEDGEVVFGNGVFKGKAGQRRLYLERFRKTFAGGRDGPTTGFLLDHPQLQDIVDVLPDRSLAHGRFRCLMQAGFHESRKDVPAGIPTQWWEGGIYENTYRRDQGVWKIQRLHYHVVFQGTFEEGWRHWTSPSNRPMKTYPEDAAGPDSTLPSSLPAWPETPVVPYHYAHPVTGKRVTPA